MAQLLVHDIIIDECKKIKQGGPRSPTLHLTLAIIYKLDIADFQKI